MDLRNLSEKTADIWRCYHWFPREKASEKHAQKFHTDTRHYRIWVVLLIRCSIFPTNQKHYLDLGSDMSSVWKVCARSWDVISRENQCWRREMSALFSRDRRKYLIQWMIKKSKPEHELCWRLKNCWSLMTFALCQPDKLH